MSDCKHYTKFVIDMDEEKYAKNGMTPKRAKDLLYRIFDPTDIRIKQGSRRLSAFHVSYFYTQDEKQQGIGDCLMYDVDIKDTDEIKRQIAKEYGFKEVVIISIFSFARKEVIEE